MKNKKSLKPGTIDYLRNKENKTQEEFAELITISTKTLFGTINKGKAVNFRLIDLLAKKLGYDDTEYLENLDINIQSTLATYITFDNDLNDVFEATLVDLETFISRLKMASRERFKINVEILNNDQSKILSSLGQIIKEIKDNALQNEEDNDQQKQIEETLEYQIKEKESNTKLISLMRELNKKNLYVYSVGYHFWEKTDEFYNRKETIYTSNLIIAIAITNTKNDDIYFHLDTGSNPPDASLLLMGDKIPENYKGEYIQINNRFYVMDPQKVEKNEIPF